MKPVPSSLIQEMVLFISFWDNLYFVYIQIRTPTHVTKVPVNFSTYPYKYLSFI